MSMAGVSAKLSEPVGDLLGDTGRSLSLTPSIELYKYIQIHFNFFLVMYVKEGLI